MLIESSLPETIASSIWGYNPDTDWVYGMEREKSSCQAHVDCVGLAAHSRRFDFFKEVFNRGSEGKSKAELSPAYRTYLFIQTGLLYNEHLSDSYMSLDDMLTNSWNMGNWLLEDGASIDPEFIALPCICDQREYRQQHIMPWTAISTTIAKMCGYGRFKPTHQTQFLHTIKILLNQQGIQTAQ